jgi:hypothetical protein
MLFDEKPWRVNTRLRVITLGSKSWRSSRLGDATSWNTGTPSDLQMRPPRRLPLPRGFHFHGWCRYLISIMSILVRTALPRVAGELSVE